MALKKIGLSYASRFETDQQGSILALGRASANVSLETLVLGFPFTMNDFLLRREWRERVGNFDESYGLNNEDQDFFIRLALAGCQMAGVDRALAYRRLYAGKLFQNTKARLHEMFRALDTAFRDPRSAAQVRALHDKAHANVYLIWSYHAFVQSETEFAQTCLREAIRLDPSILNREAARYVNLISHASVRNGGEHEASIQKLFAQLPPELSWLAQRCDWAIARGYLLRGVRDCMWGRPDQARDNFARAAGLHAEVDEPYLRGLTAHLLNYEAEFGYNAAQSVLRNLTPYLQMLGSRSSVRWLKGCFAVNGAFNDYHSGQYAKVPRAVLRAIVNDWSYLTNRGVMVMLARSIITGAGQLQV